MQSRDSLSNERPLSGVELAVATVAQWPFFDHRYPTQSRRPRPTAIRWFNRMTAPSGSQGCKLPENPHYTPVKIAI